MYPELKGRVAVITGAGGGIGRAICLRLAKEAVTIIPTGRQQENIEETMRLVREIDPENQGASFLMDVTNPEAVQNARDEILKKYGRVDVLVNNAGIPHGFAPVTDLSDDEVQKVVAVNVMGMFYVSKYFGQILRNQNSGNIVNIGSWSGKTGSKYFGIYCATKAFMHILAQSLCLEMADYNVRVNTVCGGAIDGDRLYNSFKSEGEATGKTLEEQIKGVTDFIPLHRFGTGEDMANSVAFMISDQAGYVTGDAINVCGGIEFH